VRQAIEETDGAGEAEAPPPVEPGAAAGAATSRPPAIAVVNLLISGRDRLARQRA
jgi:hypothetical protein